MNPSRRPECVLAAAVAILPIAIGARPTFDLYLQPMSVEYGWMREVSSLAFAIQSGPSMGSRWSDPRVLLSERAVKHVSTFRAGDLDRRNGAARARIRGQSVSGHATRLGRHRPGVRNPLKMPVTMRSVLSN